MKKEIKQLLTLGKLGDQMRLAAEAWDKDWKILISIIMSARTRDEVTIKVAENLFKKYKTIKELANASLKEIEKIIRPVNFFKNKAKSVSGCANILCKTYRGAVPRDFDKLIELPGVGRKTANVFLSELGGDNIGVDTHLAYCSNKLEWSKNKNPHKIEGDLRKLFPKKYRRILNQIAVRFGKTHRSKRKKDELLEKIKKIK